MQSIRTLKRHAQLVDQMASRMGVDFEQKIMEGQMAVETLGDIVLACTGCSNPEACEVWLAKNSAATATPECCRNSDVFALLKAGKRV